MTDPDPVPPALLSRQHSADYIGVSVEKLDEMRATGELPTTHAGRRKLVPRAALDAWIAANTTPNQAA